MGQMFCHYRPAVQYMEVNVIQLQCPACDANIDETDTSCLACGFLLSGQAEPMKVGDVLEARYRIDAEIGRGGMGVVYRGVDLTLKRPVAIKVVTASAADAGVLVRFMHEARSLASVEHPGLVPVYAVGQASGLYYMVMKLLNGQTVADLMNSHSAMDESAVRTMMIQVSAALQALHENDLVHCDLKPANIMMGTDGRFTVMDLGIVKAVSEDAEGVMTATAGTPRYMPPEMFSNMEVDARADLYSLGVIAYFTLSGSTPFDGPTPMSILYQQAHVKAPLLSHVTPKVSRALADIVDRCLLKDPEARFASALELSTAVKDAPVGQQSSSMRSVAALLILMVLGATGAWLALPGLLSTQSVPIADPPIKAVTAPVVTTPPKTEIPPKVETKPVPMVVLMLVSIPNGASVFSEGQRLGRTPLTLERPKGDATIQLTFKKRDYRSRKLTAKLAKDRTIKIELKPEFELILSP